MFQELIQETEKREAEVNIFFEQSSSITMSVTTDNLPCISKSVKINIEIDMRRLHEIVNKLKLHDLCLQ